MLFFVILILCFAGSFFMPWWVAAIAAFLAALWIGKTPANSFWSGFAALVIVWASIALLKTIPNDHLLASRVAHLLPLNGNWGYLLIVTSLLGGLVGGMSALSGLLVKKALKRS